MPLIHCIWSKLISVDIEDANVDVELLSFSE